MPREYSKSINIKYNPGTREGKIFTRLKKLRSDKGAAFNSKPNLSLDIRDYLLHSNLYEIGRKLGDFSDRELLKWCKSSVLYFETKTQLARDDLKEMEELIANGGQGRIEIETSFDAESEAKKPSLLDSMSL